MTTDTVSPEIAALARQSEIILFGAAPPPLAGLAGKALVYRRLTPARVQAPIPLTQISSEHDWACYRHEREAVEAAYGVTAAGVDRMIATMRAMGAVLEIHWYFLLQDAMPAGAVGLLRYDSAGYCCGRLQDVDIFPSWRGRGLGNRLLQSVEALAAAQGVEYLFIGADEDDWPLGWYLRNGYTRAATVRKPGAAAA